MTERVQQTVCPGCGLELPATTAPARVGYFNCSRECWVIWSEIMAAEYGDAVLFAQTHQLTVDAYAVQHAGGPHPDKSVAVHLAGLYLVFEHRQPPVTVAPLLKRLADAVDMWPHFPPPQERTGLTVRDVSRASAEAHMMSVRAWAGAVWTAWHIHHDRVADLVGRFLRS